jgi:hypothetical protein
VLKWCKSELSNLLLPEFYLFIIGEPESLRCPVLSDVKLLVLAYDPAFLNAFNFKCRELL